VLIALSLLALAAGVAYFAHAAHANRRSAAAWRTEALRARALVAARTAQLNQRDAALNKATGELGRLNAQVSSLETAQRSLANQKAQVEDQRGLIAIQASTLDQIAGEERTCNSELSTLLDQYAAGNYLWVTANAGTVSSDCQQAQSDFNAFNAGASGGR
jgi:chromosome segregation ATPase